MKKEKIMIDSFLTGANWMLEEICEACSGSKGAGRLFNLRVSKIKDLFNQMKVEHKFKD